MTLQAPRASVLMVDDRPENLLALEAILEPLDCELVRALSGTEALKKLLSHDFALILLDVQMPILDGFETAALIKARERSRHIPIIFVTAISKEQNYVFQGYSAGAVDYISKPFDPAILKSKVSVFVDLWQKGEQLARQAQALREAEGRELEANARERERQAETRYLTQLAQSEARFRRVVESNIFGVIFFDVHGQISEANDAFLDMVGYTRDDLRRGRVKWSEITPPEYKEGDAQVLRELEERGVTKPFEKEYLCKDGSRVAVLLGAAMLEGSQERGVCFVIDITQRKRAEAQLLSARDEAERLRDEAERAREFAERASRAKSEFLSGVSHELRTPLNAILGFSKLLLNPRLGPLNDLQRAHVDDVVQSADHLLQVINDLLDLSKIEAGKMTLERSRFSLPELLQNSLMVVREKAQAHGLQLEVEIAPEVAAMPSIEADARKIKQIMFNLLSNAVKFTPDGGSVCVRAELQSDGDILVSVQDSGIGVPLEDQERIFQAFEQVDSGYSRAQQGTGLGLPLTRQMVELHGGRMSLHSVEGEGSTFSFSLPACLLAPESASETSADTLAHAAA